MVGYKVEKALLYDNFLAASERACLFLFEETLKNICIKGHICYITTLIWSVKMAARSLISDLQKSIFLC